MSVYVDNGKISYGRMKMSHMMADSLEELHDMADKLLLKREWFQPKSSPHYDICQQRRKMALAYGAIEADRKKIVELIIFWREKETK